MDANFPACLALVLQSEGGFVDDPADPGGATNLGVTLATLSHWQGRQATVDEVRALTPATVEPIYREMYWAPTRCPDWPVGVDLMVFDQAVNQGPGKAARSLQIAAGVDPDGIIGPATQRAVRGLGAPFLIGKLGDLREAQYKALPTFPRFGRGWLARVERTREAALEMAG